MLPSNNPLPPHFRTKRPFLSEGGLETTLCFEKNLVLPEFAAFPLLDDASHSEVVLNTFAEYAKVARHHRTGLVLETPTWRASLPWIRKLGYPDSKVHDANTKGVKLLKQVREQNQTDDTPIVISGCLGPLGDAYNPTSSSSPGSTGRHDAASCCFLAETIESYRCQVSALAAAGVDQISIMTVTETAEAIAAVVLAREHALPVWVSFTVETDGKLHDGRSMADFVRSVDEATDGYASYFGINCAHPHHFSSALRDLPETETWLRERIWEVRANASDKSHHELDNSQDIDRGDPSALGKLYGEFLELLPNLKVVGGCCGTDEEHVSEIAKAVLPRK